MTTLQVESVETWAEEAKHLVYPHWQELGMDLDLEVSPDIEKMKLLEGMGMWFVATVREDGKMVGYSLNLIGPHLHYSTSPPMLVVDAYYISPECRNGSGVKLIRFTEGLGKRLGAIKVYWSCKIKRDHSALFIALGYTKSDYCFIKRI